MKAFVYALMKQRHYGFLQTDGKEVFFHFSNYNGTPELGTVVEFEFGDPIRWGQPKQAVNITPVPDSSPFDVLSAAEVKS